MLERDPNRMFLDPMNDTPDKLIYALLGYLAWADVELTYKEALLELREMLDYELARLEQEEKREAKKAAE